MYENYVKVAVRNFRKFKMYSFLNIAGLAIGIMCCLLIMLWIANELGFDRFHTKADRIYRLGTDLTLGGANRRAPMTSPPMALGLIRDYPEVVNAVRITPESSSSVKHGDKQLQIEEVRYADSSIFEVLTFPMISGDPASALLTAHSVVLTEDVARQFFDEEDPVGKILEFDGETNFTVTGVIHNVPQNSHITFDVLCSFETLYAEKRPGMEVWGWLGYYTYLLLAQGSDPKNLERKLPDFVETYSGEKLRAVGGTLELFLQPITSIHLRSNLQSDPGGRGDIVYVYLFSGIAFIILLIACINFINLATARSATRANEVGMRKTLGASRGKLVGQFLCESIICGLLSVFLASILLPLALPIFNSLAGCELHVNYIRQPWILPGFVGLALFVGFIAGSYPAFFLSSFQPVRALKGRVRTGSSKSRFRSVLVVTQFAISIALIIGTMTVFEQIRFMKNKMLGFDKEHVVVLPNVGDSERLPIHGIRNELARLPGVRNVSASTGIPGRGGMMAPFLPEGFSEDETKMMRMMDIDDRFISTLGMDMVAGRNFSAEFATDSMESAIINETAAREIGWEDPIGKIIRRRVNLRAGQVEWSPRRVVGVVKDFHLASLHIEIEPLFIGNAAHSFNLIAVRIASDNVPTTIAQLKKKWEEIAPGRPFDYYFLDESLEGQYRAEENLGNIALSFSVLAVFLACLGLFGMSSYAVEQRTKEIGVRKVLGASIGGIVQLFSKEFLILVAIANILAWPIAYYVMYRWLENYPYRLHMGLETFFLAGILAICIAMVSVSYQAVKAAKTNPVNAIKYE